MIIFNSSNPVFFDNNGKVHIRSFEVKAGEEAILTLTAHSSVKGRFEIPIYRVAGHCGEACPEFSGSPIMSAYRVDGKPLLLGSHHAEDRVIAEQVVIQWAGTYLLQSDMTKSLANPCEPIVIELHKIRRYEDTTAA